MQSMGEINKLKYLNKIENSTDWGFGMGVGVENFLITSCCNYRQTSGMSACRGFEQNRDFPLWGSKFIFKKMADPLSK